MILSMTGYGTGTFGNDTVNVEVESRSVNHRYLDIRIRAPKNLSFLEHKVKKILKQRFSRGHFDVYINLIPLGEAARKVCFDEAMVGQFVDTLREINRRFDLNDTVQLSSLIQFRELFTVEEAAYDDDMLETLLEKALSTSLDSLSQMRLEEGKSICMDLESRLDKIETMVAEIEPRLPQIVQEYRQRIQKKISELMGKEMEIDENRLLQEVVIYADRSDVTEELVRLKSHIEQFRAFLNGSESVGKKLDFLIQEMNREINTMGSKSPDIEITPKIVVIKSELERIREQVQNVE